MGITRPSQLPFHVLPTRRWARSPFTVTRSSTTTGLPASRSVLPVRIAPRRSHRPIFAVVLWAASEKTVTVGNAVTGGTANGEGVDYALASGTLSSKHQSLWLARNQL